MLFTTHATVGATVGILTGNPLLGFGAAVVSHHVLDALPHFDQGSFYMEKDRGPTWAGAHYDEKKKFAVSRDWIILFADVGICGLLFIYLLLSLPMYYMPLLLIGAFGGLLPDIFDVSPFWKEKFQATRIGKRWHRLHNFFHWPLSKKYWYFGLGMQAALITVCYFLLKNFLI